MLPAAGRMRRREEFAAALGGSRTGGRLVSGHLLVSPGGGTPKVGFVVSRTVGKAVERNRVRRRLRHIAQRYVDSLPRGSLLVLRAHPGAVSARRDDLAADVNLVVTRLLRRQGGIRDS